MCSWAGRRPSSAPRDAPDFIGDSPDPQRPFSARSLRQGPALPFPPTLSNTWGSAWKGQPRGGGLRPRECVCLSVCPCVHVSVPEADLAGRPLLAKQDPRGRGAVGLRGCCSRGVRGSLRTAAPRSEVPLAPSEGLQMNDARGRGG